MSERNIKELLLDILEATEKVIKFTHEVSFDDFIRNEEKHDAVLRNMEVIGEAANRLPEHFIQSNTHIPWHRVIGLRHRIIHEYFGVSDPIVWNIVTEKIPELKLQIQQLLESL